MTIFAEEFIKKLKIHKNMSILSITFHCTKDNLEEWENYIDETLVFMTENLIFNKYILSEVHNDYISEGQNYNLLLIFDNNNLREYFMKSEFLNISKRIEQKFGQEVIIFSTLLNTKKSKL